MEDFFQRRERLRALMNELRPHLHCRMRDELK
jgi:hypothetical protein